MGYVLPSTATCGYGVLSWSVRAEPSGMLSQMSCRGRGARRCLRIYGALFASDLIISVVYGARIALTGGQMPIDFAPVVDAIQRGILSALLFGVAAMVAVFALTARR